MRNRSPKSVKHPNQSSADLTGSATSGSLDLDEDSDASGSDSTGIFPLASDLILSSTATDILTTDPATPAIAATSSYGGYANPNVTVVYPQTYPAPVVTQPVQPSIREYRDEYGLSRATNYLIAFRDGTIRAAIAYWVDGDSCTT